MGTDIHSVFQAKKGGEWVDLPSAYDETRDYDLFGWLANVRNGHGFAGVLTGQEIIPISEPRGLPKDFVLTGDYNEDHPTTEDVYSKSWRAKYRDAGDPCEIWMGDHSHSWLTLDEILTNYELLSSVWKTGILGIDVFQEWGGVGKPESWAGGVSGKRVQIAENPCVVEPHHTHVRCFWVEGLKDEFRYFVDEVRRIAATNQEARFVFGFDS